MFTLHKSLNEWNCLSLSTVPCKHVIFSAHHNLFSHSLCNHATIICPPLNGNLSYQCKHQTLLFYTCLAQLNSLAVFIAPMQNINAVVFFESKRARHHYCCFVVLFFSNQVRSMSAKLIWGENATIVGLVVL